MAWGGIFHRWTRSSAKVHPFIHHIFLVQGRTRCEPPTLEALQVPQGRHWAGHVGGFSGRFCGIQVGFLWHFYGIFCMALLWHLYDLLCFSLGILWFFLMMFNDSMGFLSFCLPAWRLKTFFDPLIQVHALHALEGATEAHFLWPILDANFVALWLSQFIAKTMTKWRMKVDFSSLVSPCFSTFDHWPKIWMANHGKLPSWLLNPLNIPLISTISTTNH